MPALRPVPRVRLRVGPHHVLRVRVRRGHHRRRVRELRDLRDAERMHPGVRGDVRGGDDRGVTGPEAGTTDAASFPDALAGHDAEADANRDALPPSKTAVAMTLDPAGYLFVATNDGVDVFSPYPALAFVQSIGQSQFGTADAGTPLVSPDTVTGLAVDGDGHLLVSNYYETSTPGGCYFSPPASYGSDVVSYRDESTDASPPSLGAGTVLLGYPTPTPLGCVSGVSAKAGAAVFVTTDV